MATVITASLLGSINNGLTLAFNTQLYEAASVFRRFTFEAPSDGSAEVYPRLDMLRGLREFIGPREVQSLTQASFTITNRTFEQTIGVKREDIEDDRFGIYNPIAAEMGQAAARFPDLLVSQLVKLGTTTKIYDGQNFFDLAHPNFDANGNPITVANVSNPNQGPGWYLIDNSRVLKPFIFQSRVPFSLNSRFSPEDPSVFDNDEFLWGTRGRCNAGFGLWQLAYYSTATLTPAALIAARTAMALIRRPDGTPMGITPNILVVPSALYPRAMAYYKNNLIANDPSAPTTLVENDVIGMFEPIEFKWLN